VFFILFQPTSQVPATSPTNRPVAELKYEHGNKSKQQRTITKPERPSHSASVQPRVALSTVSMQNNKNENSSESKPPDTSGAGVKKAAVKNDPAGLSNSLKMERSRTTISGREWRKGKYSNNAQHRNEAENTNTNKLSASTKGHDLLDQVRKERSRPNTNDKDPVFVPTGPRESRRTKVVDETGNIKQEVQIISKDRDSLKLTSATSNFRERSSNKGQSSPFDLTRSRDERKAFKDANLPKPSLPSQRYLEGQVTPNSDSPWGSRSLLSPKSSKESLDSEWLAQVKRYGK